MSDTPNSGAFATVPISEVTALAKTLIGQESTGDNNFFFDTLVNLAATSLHMDQSTLELYMCLDIVDGKCDIPPGFRNFITGVALGCEFVFVNYDWYRANNCVCSCTDGVSSEIIMDGTVRILGDQLDWGANINGAGEMWYEKDNVDANGKRIIYKDWLEILAFETLRFYYLRRENTNLASYWHAMASAKKKEVHAYEVIEKAKRERSEQAALMNGLSTANKWRTDMRMKAASMAVNYPMGIGRAIF